MPEYFEDAQKRQDLVDLSTEYTGSWVLSADARACSLSQSTHFSLYLRLDTASKASKAILGLFIRKMFQPIEKSVRGIVFRTISFAKKRILNIGLYEKIRSKKILNYVKNRLTISRAAVGITLICAFSSD
ncbi:hypothetical protein ACG74X_13400 [Marivita sp. S0852]|uniref:hypothetical protein n=1 Tax=Marivita sp. S0852 TaxID=3373893 RepID=UPI003982C0D1